jgi:3-hydroxyacyl-[acyl-carrier-protein] dehydratase
MAIKTLSEEAAAVLAAAERAPLFSTDHAVIGGGSALDRRAIEAILPHRDPFLFVDEVVDLDKKTGTIRARYELSRAREVFRGHFPALPVFPGVLQIEAIAQAGIVLRALLAGEGAGSLDSVALTHVLAARFMRPVTPDKAPQLELAARVLEDGLFFTVVGQCLLGGEICSAAAVSGLV